MSALYIGERLVRLAPLLRYAMSLRQAAWLVASPFTEDGPASATVRVARGASLKVTCVPGEAPRYFVGANSGARATIRVSHRGR